MGNIGVTIMDTLEKNGAMVIAARLREARDKQGLSRARVEALTGISARTIEKLEAGTQEPSATRLRKLCEVLEIDPGEFMGGADRPALIDPVTTPATAFTNDKEADPSERAALILESIDAMREDDFENSTRKAMAMAQDAKRVLAGMEPEELVRLARARGLHKNERPDAGSIADRYETDPCQGHAYCGSVEDRIIDTALLGLDLWGLDIDRLHDLAESLADQDKIPERGLFGSWGDHSKVVPMLRPFLWNMATANRLPDTLKAPPWTE